MQAKIQQKLNKYIPYVHCFNHQLHLVIIHALESDNRLKQFFDTCDGLYKFSKRAAIANIYDGVRLKRLLDQRWTGHLQTVQAILSSFSDIVDMLTVASKSNTLHGDLIVLAVGYLAQVHDEQFVVTAKIMQTILFTLNPANKMLQDECIDLCHATEIIQSCVTSLQQMRNLDFLKPCGTMQCRHTTVLVRVMLCLVTVSVWTNQPAKRPFQENDFAN